MSIAKLTSKGQVTIPKSVRERLGLRTGDRLEFVLGPDGTLTIEPLGADDGRTPLAGFLEGRVRTPEPVTLAEMDHGIAEAVQRRYRGSDVGGGEVSG